MIAKFIGKIAVPQRMMLITVSWVEKEDVEREVKRWR
jgi:hypothetical protein